MRRADLVVVGAGVVGAATAWWASRLGLDVVVLERFEAGHHRGSSHGGVRVFRLAYPQPDYVRLASHALELWREVEAEGDELLDQDEAEAMWRDVLAQLSFLRSTADAAAPDASRMRPRFAVCSGVRAFDASAQQR